MNLEGKQLMEIVSGWVRYLRSSLKELQEQQPENFTPIAEFELWRVRETRYNVLLEQLKHPFVTETIGTSPFRIHLHATFHQINSRSLAHPPLTYFNIFRTGKLSRCSGSNAVQGDSPEDIATAVAALLDTWTACVAGLRDSYVLANENYKYLGTLQEFLVVSHVIGMPGEREWGEDYCVRFKEPREYRKGCLDFNNPSSNSFRSLESCEEIPWESNRNNNPSIWMQLHGMRSFAGS